MRPASRAIPSPLGPLTAHATAIGLTILEFAGSAGQRPGRARLGSPPTRPGPHAPAALLDQTEAEIAAYFAGSREPFSVPLDLRGTPFQLDVWYALLRVPRGETRSYAEIAAAIGRPAAVRAVGLANASNRLAIIVPCHRVIGADGRLSGYGGGIENKRRLLEHEGALARPGTLFSPGARCTVAPGSPPGPPSTPYAGNAG